MDLLGRTVIRVLAMLLLAIVAIVMFVRAGREMGTGPASGQATYASTGPVAATQHYSNAVASQIDPNQSKLFSRSAASHPHK